MARPKLETDERRTIDVTVALNAREWQLIATRAKRAKKTLAAFLRQAGTGDASLKIVPPINEEAAHRLRELQYLLWQLTARLEEHGVTGIDPSVFAGVQKELKQIHFDLLNDGNDQNNRR